jgi:hypothetical protein
MISYKYVQLIQTTLQYTPRETNIMKAGKKKHENYLPITPINNMYIIS